MYSYYIGFCGRLVVFGEFNRFQGLRRIKNFGSVKSQIPPSSSPFYETNRKLSPEMYNSHNVFLDSSSKGQMNFSTKIFNTFYLRIGTPFDFACYSKTVHWLRPSYFAEVSLFLCIVSNSQHSCYNRSEFTPLFAIFRQNPPIQKFFSRYLSEEAAALSEDFQFSFPLRPARRSFVYVRLPVRSVEENFNGALFCRVKITQSNQSTFFDSDLMNVRAYGMQTSYAEDLLMLTRHNCFACSAHLSPETLLVGY